MKLSKYTIVISKNEDGTYLIYNSFTGALLCLENEVYDLLCSCNAKIIEEKMDKKIFKGLVENGILIDDNFDEINWLVTRNKGLKYNMDSRRIRFTIAPTMHCNFNCYYCYESKATHKKAMSKKIIDELINFIDSSLTDQVKFFNISWYGGEPLLEMRTIKEISKRVIDLCHKKGIEYRADILTNGFLLNAKTAKDLAENCNIYNAQIPMDGMEPEYIERKGVLQGTFNKVIDNISDACKYMDIHIRMNIDKNNQESIMQLTKYLLIDRGLKESIRIYLANLRNYSNVCDFKKEDSCFNEDEAWECHNKFYEYLFELGVKNSIIKSIPAPRWISCGMSQINNLIIGPEGEFYRCAHVIGHPSHVIGNVRVGQFYNKANQNYVDIEIQEKCKKCQLLPICMGGCTFERFLNGNDSVCKESIKRLKHDLAYAYRLLS